MLLFLTALYFQLEGPIPMDERVLTGKLDNGITYFVRANKRPENRAELRLVVNAGSILEDEDQLGFAHFVEHMAFNGTRHFKKLELVNFLESIGMQFGAHLNAYTSFDETVYMLQVPTDDAEIMNKALLILEDWAHGVTMENEEIEKERGVVLEEWRRSLGVGSRIMDQQLPVFLHGSRYAKRLPIGDPEILKSGDPEALKRFYRDWYRPDLMSVVAVGDFDPEEMVKQIKTQFNGVKAHENPKLRQTFDVPSHEETLFTLVRDKELTRTTLGVMLKGKAEAEGTFETYRKGLSRSLTFMMANQRFAEKANEANPPFLGAGLGSVNFVRNSGGVQFSVAAKEDDPIGGLKALLVELNRIKQHGFTQPELDRAKTDYLRFMQSAYDEREKSESSGYASELVRHILQGESVPGIEKELEMVSKMLPNIKVEELNEALQQLLAKGSRVIWARQPEKEGVEPLTEESLLKVLDELGEQSVAAYEEQSLDQPLVKEKLQAKSILSERKLEDLGVTEWTLENGIKVVLKPTDYKDDEVFLRAFGAGGSSLGEEADAATLRMADTLVNIAGAGPYGPIELDKYMTGKVASASPYISTFEQGISGYASPKDLEWMFKLVWASTQTPRKDKDLFDNAMIQFREGLKNRLNSPSAVFSDKLLEVFTQNHPRYQPMDLNTLETIDLDKAFVFFNERFSQFNGWTFVIVGRFTLDEMKPMVETYLANLPKGEVTPWRDVNLKRPSKDEQITVHKGQEPKAEVRLSWISPFEWNQSERFKLSAARQALSIVLREALREEKGGVYGVSVSAGPSKEPREECVASIAFSTDPERVDELIQESKQQIQNVIENGVSEENLTKVRETISRDWEVQLKSNRFWLSVLSQYWRYDEDPSKILTMDERLGWITSENLVEMVKKHFTGNVHIQGLLLPEEKQPTK